MAGAPARGDVCGTDGAPAGTQHGTGVNSERCVAARTGVLWVGRTGGQASGGRSWRRALRPMGCAPGEGLMFAVPLPLETTRALRTPA